MDNDYLWNTKQHVWDGILVRLERAVELKWSRELELCESRIVTTGHWLSEVFQT